MRLLRPVSQEKILGTKVKLSIYSPFNLIAVTEKQLRYLLFFFYPMENLDLLGMWSE